MKIKRTANAGVLLEMDGTSFLLDGISPKFPPYSETPQALCRELSDPYPDVVAITHTHEDHYDPAYAERYEKETLRPVYGPECPMSGNFGAVKVTTLPTRHIGKVDVPHVSYFFEGEQCVWFTGDASPIMFRHPEKFPAPDLVILTYAYVLTEPVWKRTKSLGAKAYVLVHLPEPEEDSYGLWDAVRQTAGQDSCLFIPEIGESLTF